MQEYTYTPRTYIYIPVCTRSLSLHHHYIIESGHMVLHTSFLCWAVNVCTLHIHVHVHTDMYQIPFHYITITSSKVGISSQGPTYVIPLLSCEQVATKPTTPCCYLIFSVNGSSLDELQYCWIWYGKCHSNLNLPRPDIDSQQGGVSLSLIWTWNGKHLIELCFTP